MSLRAWGSRGGGLRRAIMALAAAAVVAACGGAELQGRAVALRSVIKRAWDNGAYRCAPRELAMAETHTAFAEQELDEGNYHRAREELDVADVNARDAIRRSPKEKCAPQVAAAQPKPLVVTRLDRDGDGLHDDEDGCPKDAEDKDGYQDGDGCPEPDNDADKILDAADKCPLVAEDPDKFEDEDGCPDEDNDKDLIADKADRCPNDPEDADKFEDEDGCPDPNNDKDKLVDAQDKCPDQPADTEDGCPKKYDLVVVTKEKIELKQTIYFATNRAKIKPRSFELLNQVAHALKDNPKIKVRIEGHTDSRGSDRFNLRLSQRRADAVRRYLVARGIAGGRMEAKGHGETAPIADNRTSVGRAQNRRVEFIITEQ